MYGLFEVWGQSCHFMSTLSVGSKLLLRSNLLQCQSCHQGQYCIPVKDVTGIKVAHMVSTAFQSELSLGSKDATKVSTAFQSKLSLGSKLPPWSKLSPLSYNHTLPLWSKLLLLSRSYTLICITGVSSICLFVFAKGIKWSLSRENDHL